MSSPRFFTVITLSTVGIVLVRQKQQVWLSTLTVPSVPVAGFLLPFWNNLEQSTLHSGPAGGTMSGSQQLCLPQNSPDGSDVHGTVLSNQQLCQEDLGSRMVP